MTEDLLWEAVLARDSTRDGLFVYAVKSTGIFCRPTCPSRRPRRENVNFFTTTAAAEAAGYRACLRCHPTAAVAPERQLDAVREACQYIDTHLDEPLSLEHLSDQVHLSPWHLQRTFKRIMGVSPRQYAETHRLQRLKEELREMPTVTDALYQAGYNSASRVYERGPARLGMTPKTYRRGGAGVLIHYGIAASTYGRLLIGATDRGICAVLLGDVDAELAAELAREYPAAEIARDDGVMAPWFQLVQQHLAGFVPHPQLSLDLQATAFQSRVWQALQEVPYGTTASYSDIARAIGQPRAVRAVARACAANRVAVLIPCHRIVREDGNLAGYRWGLTRKRQLLAGEQAGLSRSDP